MPDHFYVYPAYLTRTIARSDGRRVAASDALPDVTADEIVAAAKHLGYKAEGESGKQYPRQFFAYAGRVKVAKKGKTTKTAFLKAVAAEVARQRAAAGRK